MRFGTPILFEPNTVWPAHCEVKWPHRRKKAKRKVKSGYGDQEGDG